MCADVAPELLDIRSDVALDAKDVKDAEKGEGQGEAVHNASSGAKPGRVANAPAQANAREEKIAEKLKRKNVRKGSDNDHSKHQKKDPEWTKPNSQRESQAIVRHYPIAVARTVTGTRNERYD